MNLQDAVIETASRTPGALAVVAEGEAVTYRGLDEQSNQVARALLDLGVEPGARVGIWLDKSVPAIASMQGALRIGGAYVPVDPRSPPVRARMIVDDCELSALVTTHSRAGALASLGPMVCPVLVVDGEWEGRSWNDVTTQATAPLPAITRHPDSLAYVLYTSGSTGRPKGVCISHTNALAFVRWAAEEIEAGPSDRFSNHAPFHFDLSVLDLYVPFLVGARVCLIPGTTAYAPQRLVEFLSRERISVWYSVPSALTLMLETGELGQAADSHAPRVVLFAGEVFPIAPLCRLRETWPNARFLNLYGPTETNVCTFYEMTEADLGRRHPLPIGKACSGDEVWVEGPDGGVAERGSEGELIVSGPTVMLGYWGQPPQGSSPYRTGDIVRLGDDGNLEYVGRRDQMVKVRGHRVELGEIEAALQEHPDIVEVAVGVSGEGVRARLVAVVAASGSGPSLLDLKRHCAERLPTYMIIDRVQRVAALPRTGNGKVDRRNLLAADVAESDPTNPSVE